MNVGPHLQNRNWTWYLGHAVSGQWLISEAIHRNTMRTVKNDSVTQSIHSTREFRGEHIQIFSISHRVLSIQPCFRVDEVEEGCKI